MPRTFAPGQKPAHQMSQTTVHDHDDYTRSLFGAGIAQHGLPIFRQICWTYDLDRLRGKETPQRIHLMRLGIVAHTE
jgi:hypothetical protein